MLGYGHCDPVRAKPPLTLRDNQPDPNMEGVIAGLDAPQQPGESTQAYEQRCAAALRLRNTPMPAFFGHAGSPTMKASLPSAHERPVSPKAETEASTGVPPIGKHFCVELADNLRDRTVYQQIRNADLFEWGHSNYDDQGIIFGHNREVHDEMRNMYQSSLKAASAPGGGDTGDNGDNESDNHPNHRSE